MEIDGNKKLLSLSSNGGNTITNTINELPDDLLINILSRAGMEEAARTSVLARRWRFLWRFAHTHGILHFGNRNSATGEFVKRKSFDSLVNNALKSYKAKHVEGVVIELEEQRELYWTDRVVRDLYWVDSKMYDTWVYFAMRKQVGRFELNLLYYDRYNFPSASSLRSRSHGVSCRLRTFRLTNVNIKDKVVHYFLVSCPNLEELSIHRSMVTENLEVIDPPSLRVLKLSKCPMLKKLVISAATLVSLTYTGFIENLHMLKVPNLREMSVCSSFRIDSKKHRNYSVHWEKLVLDLRLYDSIPNFSHSLPQDHFRSLKRLEVFVVPDPTVLDLTLLIKKTCPQLREFRIEMSYMDWSFTSFKSYWEDLLTFGMSEYMELYHRNLKLVEIGGYRGDRGEERLVLGLIKIFPSIERVVIDTEFDYFDLPYCTSSMQRAHKRVLPPAFFERQTENARNRAKERAKCCFASKLPQRVEFLVT